MGRLALQLLQSALVALGTGVVGFVADRMSETAAGPAPAGVSLPVWGLIAFGLTRVAGFISAKFGPKKATTTASVPR